MNLINKSDLFPHNKHSKVRACKIVMIIIQLSFQAHKEGLLALDANVNKLPKSVLRKSLQLVVDGLDPDLIVKLFKRELKKHPKESIEYFEIQLMQKGVFMLQQGCSGTEMFYNLAPAFSLTSEDELTSYELDSLLQGY